MIESRLRRIRVGTFVPLLLGATTGCGMIADWAEGKADEALQEELKKGPKRIADEGDDDGVAKSSVSDGATAGESWTSPFGGAKTKLEKDRKPLFAKGGTAAADGAPASTASNAVSPATKAPRAKSPPPKPRACRCAKGDLMCSARRSGLSSASCRRPYPPTRCTPPSHRLQRAPALARLFRGAGAICPPLGPGT